MATDEPLPVMGEAFGRSGGLVLESSNVSRNNGYYGVRGTELAATDAEVWRDDFDENRLDCSHPPNVYTSRGTGCKRREYSRSRDRL
jgi:hypothetical protein